jgi:hypothetical protein
MIKIIRLQNGEDIIGNVNTIDLSTYEIEEPMTVAIDYRGKEAGLLMQHWLPVQLVKENRIVIGDKDIIGMFEPNDTFCEYYYDTVSKIKELLSAKTMLDGIEDEELDEIMEALEEFKQDGNTLH